MSDVVVFQRFRVKRDTAANFTAANTLLLEGEFALETDTRKLKIGDGSTAWNDLDYIDAAIFPFDNSTSGLAAENVQTALDELASKKIEDAPSDGKTYGRKDATWAEVSGGGGGGAWSLVKKSVDEARNNVTTRADDSALVLSLAADTVYRVRFFVLFNTPNTATGMAYGFNYTGTAASVTRRIVLQRGGRGSPSGTDNELVGTDSDLIAAGVLADSVFGIGLIECELVIKTVTAGDLSFIWAQSAANAADLTVLAGSYIEWAEFP